MRLVAVVIVSVALQLAIQHVSAAQRVFLIGALSIADCAVALLVALGPLTSNELAKLVRRFFASPVRR